MGGVTTHGIRYPDGASKAKNLGPELKIMAEDIDWYIGSYLSPTGPIRQIIIGVVEEIVPPIVRDEVDDYLDGKGFVDGESTYTPAPGTGDDVAWGLVDAAGKRLPIELSKDGHWSGRARRMIVDDTKDFMGEALGITTWPGEGYGVGAEFVDRSGKLLMQFDEAGHLVYPVEIGSSGGSSGGSQAVVPDAINEWWVEPSEVWNDGRLLFGGVTSDGKALVCEWRPGVPARSIIVGDAIVDDHCASTPLVLGDGSVLVLWTIHGRDWRIRTVLGDPDGTIESCEDGIGIRTDFNIGGQASYTQAVIVEHLSDETKTVIYCFTRRSPYSWGIVPITVTHATRAVTAGAYIPVWSSETNERQTYVTCAPARSASGQQVLRLASYYNPAVAVGGPIWTFQLNLETGEFSAPDRTLTGTLGTTTITDAEPTSLPALAASSNRRLFYTGAGPGGWAVAYAEGDIAAPDAWVYKLAEYIDGDWVVSDFGIAGPRIGFTPEANYLGGMGLPSVRHGRSAVALARNSGAGATIEVWRHNGTEWQSKVIANGTKLARPRFTHAGVLYAQIDRYGSGAGGYKDYYATMRTAQEGRY